MSYTKTTDFQVKDGLASGNPLRIVKGTEIDDEFDAIATADALNLKRDGTAAATANIPMGTYKFTGLGSGSAATDSANLGQVQAGAYQLIGSISGVDTITGSLTPAIYAYAAGQKFSFVAVGANTGAATININGLGAKSITKYGATALVAGDIPNAAVVEIEYDGTQFQLCNLVVQNAATVTTTIASGATGTTQSAADNSTKIATTAYQDRVKDKLFDVDATVAANAMTLTINPCVLDFRSTTLTDGTPVTRTISAAINTVISSGSTGGTTSGVQSDIVIAAIDNAGTVEVAWTNLSGGQDLSETGLISTTAEGGAGAADSATTWYSTTARTNVAYRVVGMVRSTQATAGTWATTPSLVQGEGGQAVFSGASMLRLNTANGFGSTNTAIRRFTNVLVNRGSDFTYADSATLGASVTINNPGVYAINYTESFTTINTFGISLNSSQLTTYVLNITAADILTYKMLTQTQYPDSVGIEVWLNAGDIIRPHTNPGLTNGLYTTAMFTVVRSR